MRRSTTLVGLVFAALALALPAAFAANPGVNHFRVTDIDTDTDFCGTGKTVNISVDIVVTEFLSPNQPVDYRNTSEGNVVFTNPANGNSVIDHFAGPFSDTVISGDPEGLHVDEVTYKGLPEQLRMAKGRLLLRDAGYIVFHITFNGEDFVSSETIIDRGPHPDAESDFVLFCQVMTSALGL